MLVIVGGRNNCCFLLSEFLRMSGSLNFLKYETRNPGFKVFRENFFPQDFHGLKIYINIDWVCILIEKKIVAKLLWLNKFKSPE